MRDELSFDLRLADALGRYAELAPSLDNAAIVRHAVGAPRSVSPAGWVTSWLPVRRSAVRLAYLISLVALLLVAVFVGVLIGSSRPQLIIPVGGNGAIALYVQGFDHSGGGFLLVSEDGTIAVGSLGLCPKFSADGSTVAYRDGDRPSLFVANADGTNPRVVSDVVEMGVSEPFTFALSPDGKSVAWFEDGTLWQLSVDGGPRHLVLSLGFRAEQTHRLPAWSPDGRKIAFVTVALDAAGQHRSGISVVDVDGGQQLVLSSRRAVEDIGVSWSPDGQHIVYTGEPDDGIGPPDVFVSAVDGSGERNVTNSAAYEALPGWSPDGRQLAFISRPAADAASHVFTMPIDGAAPSGPAVEGPETPWFVWSPDASKLLWLETTSNGSGDRSNTLKLVDRNFQQPSTTVQSLEGDPLCRPSWQRIAR